MNSKDSLLIKFTESQCAWPFRVMVDLLLRHDYTSGVLDRLAVFRLRAYAGNNSLRISRPLPYFCFRNSMIISSLINSIAFRFRNMARLIHAANTIRPNTITV